MDIDPPDHSRYRRILDPLFSPREVARFEPQFTALAHQLIDGFAGRGRCEFAAEFAVPLPSMPFLSMLGLPLDDLPLLLELKDGVLRPPADEPRRHLRETAQRINDYFEGHLRTRSGADDGSVIAALVHAQQDGDRLTYEEVLDVLFMFVLAGLDTVTASLECFVVHLARHPDHRDLLVARPDLIPGAVEELLRWESPVSFVPRRAVHDVIVGGVHIATGSPVGMFLGSGNTDEHAVANADQVDFEREPNRHMAFGRGIHRCLGSHLARLELKVALRVLHERIPRYEIESGTELRWHTGNRAVDQLPLVFPVGPTT